MIAHSFKGEEFGPAQGLHGTFFRWYFLCVFVFICSLILFTAEGATYTVDAEIKTSTIEKDLNWVIDIGVFTDLLSETLQKYNFKHLNEIFTDDNTTTEFMCKVIHSDLRQKLKKYCKRENALTVKLHESHKAWASYTSEIGV